MPRGVPGTGTGYALGHPGTSDDASRARLLPSPAGAGGSLLNGRNKQSTRFRGIGASIAACFEDLGQYDTDLSIGGTAQHLFEASPASARFDVGGGVRTILFRLEANDTDTGNLYRHGAADPDRLRFSAANTIQAVVNNSTVLTYTVTGLTAVRKQMVIAWVTQPNDDTTGASDAMLSHLLVWNVTDGTFDQVAFEHAASTTKAQTIFFGAADNTPTLVFTGTITGIHFEGRRASATEIAHDWIANLATPSTETENDHQGLPPSTDIALDAQNYFHGPLAAWCTDVTRRLRYRLLSSLWNECMRISTELTQAELASATDPWIRGAPDSNTWRMHFTFLRSYPVPPWATHLWVRVQLRSYVAAGAPVPLGVRLYSFNKNPSIPGGEALVPYHAQEIVTRDDAGEGSYVLRKRVPISKDAQGWTWLAVALAVDPLAASANDSNARVRVQAVHASPTVYDELGDAGFGGGLGG